MEDLDKYLLGHLLKKMENRPEINLIVLADHGMININQYRVHYISDYLPKEWILRSSGSGSYHFITPATGFTTKQLMDKLKPLLETGGFRAFVWVFCFI